MRKGGRKGTRMDGARRMIKEDIHKVAVMWIGQVLVNYHTTSISFINNGVGESYEKKSQNKINS